MRISTLLTGNLLGALLLLYQPVRSQGLQLSLTPYATGFDQPLDLTTPPGETRLFVVEKRGRIKIIGPGGTVAGVPFLDITTRVTSRGGEQGLLGLAFHPNYATNGFFFVNYIDLAGNTRVSRFTRTTPDAADSTSEVVLMTIVQPVENHNGGCMKFGPDGLLYIASGDGGGGGDPNNLAQNLTTHLGKLLRIDVDAATGGRPYGIPPSNPFATSPNGEQPEIWAWGLRNPWRFSFDRQTGDLWLGDVGQDSWEEVNFWPASASTTQRNFGWRCYEATHPFNLTNCQGPSNYVAPIFEYPRNLGRSVTGGFVYRGTQYPALQGRYVFTDLVSGRFWTISAGAGGSFLATIDSALTHEWIATFGEDAAGELYCAHLLNGTVYRLAASNPQATPDDARQPSLCVVPNPARGTCLVTLPPATTAVELLSLVTGQQLRRGSVATAGSSTFDLRGLAPGLYAIRATTATRTWTARLLVE